MHLDWHQLLSALGFAGDGQYGLDRVSGRLRFFDLHELQSDDPRGLWDEAHFIMVEPLPEWSFGEWILAFAEEQDGDAVDLLVGAARETSPLIAVRRALHGRPPLEEAWQRFHRERMQSNAEEWVAAQGLVPDNPPPWRS